MKNKVLFILLTLLFATNMVSQVSDSLRVPTDSIMMDTTTAILPANIIQNAKALPLFWKKMEKLKKSQSDKINIVHIGDSHIQADLMTSKVRKSLQNILGNAGRGFVFPHSLARTNGSADVKFESNNRWKNHRIVAPTSEKHIGLSGIALSTTAQNFAVKMSIKEAESYFKTIKIITTPNNNSIGISINKKIITSERKVVQKMSHTIKKGEVISVIANKYNISVSELKNANGLKLNAIRAGKKLNIPGNETKIVSSEKSEFMPLQMISDTGFDYYTSEQLVEEIYLIPKQKSDEYCLNGIVLENGNPGLLYHNIGVNGAQLTDYNKYPLFFEQLKTLSSDLIIVSLGTNESFDKMTAEDFMNQLEIFIQNVKNENPTSELLVITPPPSLFQRKITNTFVEEYTKRILSSAVEKNYAVWDMFAQLGGNNSVRRNHAFGILGNDGVHYTKKGYEIQADLYTAALLKTLELMSGK